MPPKLVPVICRKLGPNNFECPLPKNHPGKHNFGEDAEPERTKPRERKETIEREQKVIQQFKTAAEKARQQMERQLFSLQTAIKIMSEDLQPYEYLTILAEKGVESDTVGALRQLEGRLKRELQESDRYNEKAT